MKRLGRRLPGYLIPMTLALVGLALGLGVFLISNFIHQRGSWEALDTPPGSLLSLAAATDRHVIVETSDGDFFEIYCQAQYPEERCWEETGPPPEAPVHFACDDYWMPTPSGPVRDLLPFCFRHEYISLTQYVLMEDGSLWRWHVITNPLGQVAGLFWSAVLGAVVGAITGVYVWLARNGVS
jgi:hypothetical protein